MVDNIFYQNSELKELLSQKNILPADNIKIHDLIEKDIWNFQNDLWIKKKVEKAKVEAEKKSSWSITGLHLRKITKEKVLAPVGKASVQFAKNHKIKVAVVASVVAFASYSSFSDLQDVEKLKTSAATSVVDYQDNNPGNVLHLEQELDLTNYVAFVESVGNIKLSRNLKMDVKSDEFKEYDKLYGRYMHKLQNLEEWKDGLELTQEEGKTFLVMQYISTNSFVDYLKDKGETLKWKEAEKNDYLTTKYKYQLTHIENAMKDMKSNREGKLKRKIKSWDTYFTYYTDVSWKFIIQWLKKKEFKF